MSSLHTGNEHNQEMIKKQYITPRVQVYGDLRQITQSVGQTGMGDGAPNKAVNQKTAP
jgi:hypothetical protein